MIKAPQEFNGTLDELYDRYSSHILLSLEAVKDFHQNFQSYYRNDADPLYLIRNVSGLKRGETVRTAGGNRLRGTDNSPAWWIHYQLFYGKQLDFLSPSAFFDAVPCHMFRIRLPEHVNKLGWHVAHIYDAKDRNLDYHHWDRDELLRRTVRNIHPCNYFYIPKVDWQKHGGDPKVIAYFYAKFESLYKPVWEEFLRLVDGRPLNLEKTIFSNQSYHISSGEKSRNVTSNLNISDREGVAIRECKVEYHHHRLCFKADLIEPLAMDDYFCIVTDEGAFEMSKKDFYNIFANVVASQSYQVQRQYHYPTIPQKAASFKVS